MADIYMEGENKMTVRRIEIDFKLPIKLIKRKKWYVASCPVLDVVTQGETKRKAKENLKEALSLFIETCIEQGTLDLVMKNCGFKPAKQTRIKSKAVVSEEEYVHIPIPLLTTRPPNKECRA